MSNNYIFECYYQLLQKFQKFANNKFDLDMLLESLISSLFWKVVFLSTISIDIVVLIFIFNRSNLNFLKILLLFGFIIILLVVSYYFLSRLHISTFNLIYRFHNYFTCVQLDYLFLNELLHSKIYQKSNIMYPQKICL